MPDYSDHYSKFIPAYKELSECNQGKTVWIPTDQHDGWYVNTLVQDDDSEAWKRGYTHKSRPSVLPDDLSSEVERTAYTTISYAKDQAYNTAYFRKSNGEIEWMDGFSDRLPDYGDMTAWALFVDIDIHKDYKKRPLPEEHRDIVRRRLDLWVQAFSEIAGGTNHVKVLDSGGGMYVFVPPPALSPIADEYDAGDLNLVFDHIGERMRQIVGRLDDLICEEDEGPQKIFSADKVQNKNRQFKTIGSIHKSLNTVVHPIDPEDVNIKRLNPEDVDDSDVENSIDWASDFTSEYHDKCVGSVVEYMFQGSFTQREDMDMSYVEGSNWKKIIDNWLEDKKESIKRWEESQRRRENISDEKLKTDITQNKEVASESVSRVNDQMLKNYIIDFLGSDRVHEKTGDEMDFFPFWRSESTQSGRSAFYDVYEGNARFTDKADGTSRDIVYWVALEMTYDNDEYPDIDMISSPSEDLSAKQYSMCIDELRSRGEEIPILVPEIEDNEELPDWRIRQIALDLGIAEEEDLLETENGKSLPPSQWNQTIERLDHEDIVHNRSKKQPLRKEDINPYVGPEMHQKASREKIYKTFFNEYGHYAPDFSSKEQYTEFIDDLPKFVIPFTYEGEINGNSTDRVLAGVFVDQTKKKVTMSRFEPFPVDSVNAINRHTDVKIEIDKTLLKSEMKILVNQGEVT